MNVALTPVRFLERATSLFKERSAVVCGEDRWTYREFGLRVECLANALEDLGIGHGDKVVFLGYNCHRLLECYFGIVKIGAVLVPLNIRLTPNDFEYIFNDCKPAAVFVHPDFASKLDPFLKNISSVKHCYLLEPGEMAPEWAQGTYDELLAGSSPDKRRTSVNYPFVEDDAAELFYTSGTTGKSKGVILTHRNLYLHALSKMASMPIYETDVQLHLISLFHVNGWGTPHYITAKGGRHVIQKSFDPEGVLKLVQEEKVTRFYAVPTMVLSILELPNISNYDLSSLREVLIGGASPPIGLCAKAEKVFGCQVHGAFGTSETCPNVTWPELPPNHDSEILRHRAHETWGFPMCGVEFKIIDGFENELPWDGKAVGELLVRGDMVMKEYLNKPEETEKTLVDGWYRTGDLVSMGEDGSLYIRDRAKDIIISGGENISSLEIEQVLYSHPDILECAVIGKKDPKWGEIPKAVVVLKAGSRLTSEDIVYFAREKIAHFKAIREAEIVDSLSHSGTGKIMKRELRRIYG